MADSYIHLTHTKMKEPVNHHIELIQDVARTMSLINQLASVASIKGNSEFKEIRIKEILSQLNDCKGGTSTPLEGEQR